MIIKFNKKFNKIINGKFHPCSYYDDIIVEKFRINIAKVSDLWEKSFNEGHFIYHVFTNSEYGRVWEGVYNYLRSRFGKHFL